MSEQRFDTMWSRSFKGWFIHGKYDRQLNREVIDIQRPDGKFLKHNAKSALGARRLIAKTLRDEARNEV